MLYFGFLRSIMKLNLLGGNRKREQRGSLCIEQQIY